jgi:hypothetical protein
VQVLVRISALASISVVYVDNVRVYTSEVQPLVSIDGIRFQTRKCLGVGVAANERHFQYDSFCYLSVSSAGDESVG